MHVAGVATDSLTHLAALFQRTSQIAMEYARKRIAKARAEEAISLDLSGLGLTKLPGETWELVKLTELYCSWNQLTSLEGLDKLVSLTKLDCEDNELTSLEGLDKLVDLTELHCYENQLTSLEGLDKLVNLTTLYCNRNQLTSLEGLDKLVNLTELRCEENELTLSLIHI